MKFTVSLFTLLSIAAAATSFGAVTIRSGSQYQYATIVSGDSVTVGSGDSVEFVLNNDGSLVDAKTNKYLNVDDNKNIVELDKPLKKFSIEGTNLYYDGKQVFSVNPDGQKLTVGSGDNTVGVNIYITGKKEVDDITPKEEKTSSTKSASATKTKSASKATKTATATKTESKSTATAAADTSKDVKFGVVSIASGTKFQYAAIKKVESHPHVFSVGGDEGSDVSFTLKTDTSLVDQDGRGVYWDSKTGELGNVAPFGRQAATTGFSIKDGHLVLDGKDNWKACPSGDNKYSLANNDCTGGTGIALHVLDATNA